MEVVFGYEIQTILVSQYRHVSRNINTDRSNKQQQCRINSYERNSQGSVETEPLSVNKLAHEIKEKHI